MDRKSRLLQNFTRDWPGRTIGKHSLIRVVNEDGHKPPLIWCYNSAGEFPAMARGLGPDQPIIGIRSLNMVSPYDDTRFVEDMRFADIYIDDLIQSGIDLTGCIIGGNCQGASIAVLLASRLMLRGCGVATLVMMEQELPVPYPGKVAFIFGAESETFNPFLKDGDPTARWKRLYPAFQVEIIPGAHGDYFGDLNLPNLSDALQRIIDAAIPPPSFEQAIRLQFSGGRIVGTVGSPLKLQIWEVGERPAPADDLVLSGFWVSASDGLIEIQDPQPLPAGFAGARNCVIFTETPQACGSWSLNLFACGRETGPLSWVHDFCNPIKVLMT